MSTTPTNDIITTHCAPMTVANGLKTPKKKARGTKQCSVCLGRAKNNNQKNCHHCGKNGHIVSEWLKYKKKTQTIKKGKVCPAFGCGWSTKGNRTMFCGDCGHPFPCSLKRKASPAEFPKKKKPKKSPKKVAPSPKKVAPTVRLQEFDSMKFDHLYCGPVTRGNSMDLNTPDEGSESNKKTKKSQNNVIVHLKEFDSMEFGNFGFTPLSRDNSLDMDALFLQEDMKQMYSSVPLPNEDYTHWVTDSQEFTDSQDFQSRNSAMNFKVEI